MNNTYVGYNPYKKNSQKGLKIFLVFIGLFIIVAVTIFLLDVKKNSNTFVVTFMDTDGIYSIQAGIKKNSVIAAPVVEPREGYEFLGWYKDNEKFDFDTPIKEDIYLDMKWFSDDTYEVDEISDSEKKDIKIEQEQQKKQGTVKTKTAEEVKKEKEQSKPTSSPSTTTTPTSSPSTTTKPTTSPSQSPSTTTQPTTSPTPTGTTQPTTSPEPTIAPVETVTTVELSSKNILCTKGSVAKISIKVTPGSVKSYGSNNNKIAIVSESKDQPNCLGCKQLDIQCVDTGTTKINIETDNGIKETATVTVKEKTTTVAFQAKTISCTKGETIQTIINAGESGVKSYTSSNTNVAEIRKSATQPNCIGCLSADIICKNSGTATLTAESNDGVKATSEVTVKDFPVKFVPATVSCYSGETKIVTVEAGSDGIKSFVSNNTEVITVSNSAIQPKCIGCRNIDIKCLNAGTTTITATSNKGIIGTATVNVSGVVGPAVEPVTDKLEVTPTTITCTPGLIKIISINSGNVGVKSYVSSNTNVASLSKSLNQPKCLGCLNIDVACKSAGKATVTVTSEKGKTAKAEVTVNEITTTSPTPTATSNITFTPTAITCAKDETKSILISASKSTIKSYTSSKTDVATLTADTNQPNCEGCVSVKVKCLKAGTSTLTAIANDGAKKTTTITVKAGTDYKATAYCALGELITENGKPTCKCICSYTNNPQQCTTTTETVQSNECNKWTCSGYDSDYNYEYESGGFGYNGPYNGQCTTAAKCKGYEKAELIYRSGPNQYPDYNCTCYNKYITQTNVSNKKPYEDKGYSCSCSQYKTKTIEKTNCVDVPPTPNYCNLDDDGHLKYSCPNGGTLDTKTNMCKF